MEKICKKAFKWSISTTMLCLKFKVSLLDLIELYVVVLCSYRPMNYGGTRCYKSSLKDLLKDRKNTY